MGTFRVTFTILVAVDGFIGPCALSRPAIIVPRHSGREGNGMSIDNRPISVRINGLAVEGRAGQNILEAAKTCQFEIPAFCDEKSSRNGVHCHMCLVEIVGRSDLVLACRTRIEEGQQILTFSPRVLKARRQVLWQIVNDHPGTCLFCEKSGACQLKKYCSLYGVDRNGPVRRQTVPFQLLDGPDPAALSAEEPPARPPVHFQLLPEADRAAFRL
jgi:hypothetical protein